MTEESAPKKPKNDPTWHKFQPLYEIDVGTEEIGEGAVALRVYGNVMPSRLPTLRTMMVRYQLNPATGKSEAVDFGVSGRAAVFIDDVDPNKVHDALVSIKEDQAKMQQLYKSGREFRTTPYVLAAFLQNSKE